MGDLNKLDTTLGVLVKMHDNGDGSFSPYEAAIGGIPALGTAGGPALYQSAGVWANRITNPTGVDITLAATPSSSPVPANTSTLSAATTVVGQPSLIPVGSVAALNPGDYLAIDSGANLEYVQIGSVSPIDESKNLINSGNAIQATLTKTHLSGVGISGGMTFFLTDFVVTGSPASGNPLVMFKYLTTVSSGSITLNVAAQPVLLTNIPTSAKYGGQIFVGQVLDVDVVGGGSYEAVVVTAVSTNTSGIVTGFSAVFTKNHGALCLIGVPIEGAQINATKGIEEIGIETQPTAPPGSTLAINIGAFTGLGFYNARGFFQ